MMFLCTFLIINYADTFQESLKKKYNSVFNCQNFQESYTEQEKQTSSADEWHDFYDSDKQRATIRAELNCFCLSQYKIDGTKIATQEWPDSKGQPTATCFEWVADSYGLYGFQRITGFVISLTNFLLTKVLIHTIQSRRIHSVSGQANIIMISVFVATFLNTGIMMLLKNANFKENESEYLNTILHLG